VSNVVLATIALWKVTRPVKFLALLGFIVRPVLFSQVSRVHLVIFVHKRARGRTLVQTERFKPFLVNRLAWDALLGIIVPVLAV